jgi:hypothetical protein
LTDEDDESRAVRQADEDAALAESELASDFPVLHSFAAVALWSWLENFVKDLLVEILYRDRAALEHQAFLRIKIRFSEYAALRRREQMAYLVEQLEQETSAPLKLGINRFESLLDSVKLAGPTPQEVIKWLFELQQIRNAIAHRNGRCDMRLKTNCPWLKLKIGEPIRISTAQLTDYASASVNYGTEILYRMGDRYSFNLRPEAGDALTDTE